MSLTLSQALRCLRYQSVAFVGSGGKTTAMFRLARNLNPPVIVTASSHLGIWQSSLADHHILGDSVNLIQLIEKQLSGVTLLSGFSDGDRFKPITDELLARIHEFCKHNAMPLLIEADGARQKPLKGWADHEPPIPAFADHIVQVVGLGGLGKPLTEEFVHRPEIFSRLSELKPGEKIDVEAVTQVLLHPDGAQKNFPQGARRTVLLNQADTPELQASARGMAQPLLAGFDSVVISEVQQDQIYAAHERVAGIILAAGESSRFGQPKQLLDWRGEPFARVVAKKALAAGLSPVLLVTGANAEQVETTVRDLDVKIVKNSEWKSGQASSIRNALNSFVLPPPPFGHLPQIQNKTSLDNKNHHSGFGGGWEGVGSCIFLLVDQPQITTSILEALKEKHAESLYPILAPMVMDRRANPVLFDRETFPDLLELEGDVGGRAIFHKHRVEYLPWHDDGLLLDVDTPEQYQRLISNEYL